MGFINVEMPIDVFVAKDACLLEKYANRVTERMFIIMYVNCPACSGTGRVTVINTIITDRGTKWQQSADEQVEIDCTECENETTE